MKRFLGIIAIVATVFFQVGCIDDEGVTPPDFPPLDRGTIEVNRIQVTVNRKGDTANTSTYEYYDADGVGGNPPSVNQRIMLEVPVAADRLEYDAKIRLFKDAQEVTNDIKELETAYVLCYRGMDDRNLGAGDRDNDRNGKALGLEVELITFDESSTVNQSNGSGTIDITLNYQIQNKDGSCDAGIRILEIPMSYQIN